MLASCRVPLLVALFAATLFTFGSNSAAEPVSAQNVSGITSPSSGSEITGDVPVMGTAIIDPFQKYELYYKLEPSGDDAYIYFDGNTVPVVNGQLATWNAAALAPGVYSIRLRVVKLDGNYAEYFAPNLSVNQGPAPTPTSDQPTVTPIPSATFTPAPQPTPDVGDVAQPELEEEEAPLLQPTSTPASLAVVVNPQEPAAGAVEEEASGSLTRELGEALSLDRLSEFFYTGVRWSATIFFIILVFYGGKWLIGWLRSRS